MLRLGKPAWRGRLGSCQVSARDRPGEGDVAWECRGLLGPGTGHSPAECSSRENMDMYQTGSASFARAGGGKVNHSMVCKGP